MHHPRKRNWKSFIRREAGAVDLASIMVGVIITGVLAAIIGVSVFG